MSEHVASQNTGPGGAIHIGTAVVAHGGPGGSGQLPFTGASDLGLCAIAGLAMIAAGLRLRRRGAA